MLGSNMSALQGFAGSDATSTALSFTTGSAVRHPSLRVKQRRLFSDSVRRRRHSAQRSLPKSKLSQIDFQFLCQLHNLLVRHGVYFRQINKRRWESARRRGPVIIPDSFSQFFDIDIHLFFLSYHRYRNTTLCYPSIRLYVSNIKPMDFICSSTQEKWWLLHNSIMYLRQQCLPTT